MTVSHSYFFHHLSFSFQDRKNVTVDGFPLIIYESETLFIFIILILDALWVGTTKHNQTCLVPKMGDPLPGRGAQAFCRRCVFELGLVLQRRYVKRKTEFKYLIFLSCTWVWYPCIGSGRFTNPTMRFVIFRCYGRLKEGTVGGIFLDLRLYVAEDEILCKVGTKFSCSVIGTVQFYL